MSISTTDSPVRKGRPGGFDNVDKKERGFK
jgi:hypothetical protein